jgi:hypothetical protein
MENGNVVENRKNGICKDEIVILNSSWKEPRSGKKERFDDVMIGCRDQTKLKNTVDNGTNNGGKEKNLFL